MGFDDTAIVWKAWECLQFSIYCLDELGMKVLVLLYLSLTFIALAAWHEFAVIFVMLSFKILLYL